VAVVGAGPGGLFAGEHAARANARVVVIDRKKEIGNPVRCAEGLGAYNFEALGLEFSDEYILNTVNKACIVSPKGKRLEVTIPYKEFSMYVLERSGFERMLAARLKKHGGKLLMDTAVTGLIRRKEGFAGLRTTKGEITAKIIIGADGVESRIGRWCKLSKRLKANEIFTTAQYTLAGMDDIDDHFEIHFGSRYAPGGYAWVFPKGEGRANLGIGLQAKYNKRPLELLRKFKADRAKDAHPVRLMAGCIPSTLPLENTVRDNVIIVGDAARQTNAVSGGGIANALIAGKIAGEVAGNTVEKQLPMTHLKNYDSLWRRELEKTLQKKFRQRKYLENDGSSERLIKIMRFLYVLKPLLPKSLLVRWLRPDF
jgi:digeranylgeranylglycerophospholipid reductase